MEHTPPTIAEDRPFRIPTAVWLAAASLIAALVAVFVFRVAVGTVLVYGLIGLMVLGHLFMHGGHGSHSGHAGHAGHEGRPGATASVDGPANAAESGGQHTGHGRCC